MHPWLVTADWQTDSRNLDRIAQAIGVESDLMQRSGAQALIDLGDQKQPYNPIDARIEFAMRERWRDKTGIMVKGNHDRLSQNDDHLSWLPLIKRKGVTVCSDPVTLGCEGFTAFVLPYHSDAVQLAHQAQKLAEQARRYKTETVLLFHCDVKQADYGNGYTPENAIDIADLQLNAYTYAFGGHVHKPQKIAENAWYVGSPFAHNWGEVNEQKRFLIYTPGKGVHSVPTGLPGYFDWENVKGSKPEDLQGSTVRITIPAKDGTEFRVLEAKRREQFAKKYPGVNLHCVAEYQQQEIVDYSFTQGSDREKVTAYVAQRYDGDKWLSKYVIATLEKVSGKTTTNTEGLTFYQAKATHYTSFKDLAIDYRQRGLVLVRGDNQDWPGRSNAAGKSNLFDVFMVAMFDKTRKGQKADHWAADSGAKKASVKLWFKNAQGQKVCITRGRRPAKISVTVNGEDRSSGLTGKEKDGTQGLITALSGYDLRMLTNAVYINQDQAQAFLAGTRKEKSELLYRYQGLERFDEARKIVTQQYAEEQAKDMELYLADAIAEAQYTERQEQLDQLTSELNSADESLMQAQDAVRNALTEKERLDQQLKDMPQHSDKVMLALYEKLQKIIAARDACMRERDALWTKIQDIGSGICGECGQALPGGEAAATRRKKLELQHKKWDAQYAVEETRAAEVQADYNKKLAQNSVRQTVWYEWRDQVSSWRQARQMEESVRSSAAGVKAKGDALVERMTVLSGELAELRKQRHRVKQRLSLMDRAKACLDRTGIPAYLCGLLCPVLTKAAQHYAQIFAEDAIQVVFEFSVGDFDCKVLNTQGSSELEGLSAGENSTAALIVAFALRSAAPKTNVLILDEPGRGLDEVGQRMFAAGLEQLKHEFETIFLTTHERALETNLHADAEWTVVKHHRVSKVVLN